MFKAMKKWWRYWGAKLNRRFEEKADPAVQLEQAIAEAQDQHRQLREQAANVIANQKQLEMRLNRSLEEYERTSSNARQALLMAEEAQRNGDEAKLADYTHAAETFATQMITLEGNIEETKALVLAATQAAEQAKTAVSQNSSALQKKLAERQKLLSQLDQAKMQEQMNTAMASLSESVDTETPSFDQVRDKIETRYAKAKSMTELTGQGVEARMLEIEHASRNVEAQARLSELRSQLGLAPAEGTDAALGTGAGEAAAVDATPAAGALGSSSETPDEQATTAPAAGEPAAATRPEATPGS
ncbi:MAG: PspA/IM30 family protein [Acidimicrobiia bacterium]|nr:PspA/IM30 family protein [Acidimicrobiia bacterium]